MVSLETRIGRFQTIELISATGLASTYRAHDAHNDRVVTLKVLRRYFQENPELVERYFAELRLVAQWQHPNILPVYDVGHDDGEYWVASRFVPTGSLRDQARGLATLGEAAAIARQLASALAFAHERGVLHRNLSPSSVVLTPDDTVQLTDFGITTLAEGVHPLVRATLATPQPAFMSPEQASGAPLDSRSDGYALAALVYWMLTGEAPFPGSSAETVYAAQIRLLVAPPSRINLALPSEADRIVLKGLGPFPAVRYEECEQFAVELTEAAQQQGSPVEVPRAGDDPPSGPGLLQVTRAVSTGEQTAGAGDGVDSAWPKSQSGAGWLSGWGKRAHYVTWRERLPWIAVPVLLAAAWVWFSSLPPPVLPPASSELSSASPPGLWTMPRYDLGNTAAAPLLAPFRGDLKWSFRTGEDLEASPAVTEDSVYIATRDRRIVALDATTGAVRWEVPSDGPISASPVIAGGTLFQGLREGRLLALQASDGTLLWQFATGKIISAAVTVADGVVYLPSSDGNLYTLDAATGERRWTFPVRGWITAPPAIWEDRVAVGSREGWVYVLDARSGEKLFDFPTGGPVVTAPALAGHTVYTGSANRLFTAIDTRQRVAFRERQLRSIQLTLFFFGWAAPPPPPTGFVWQQPLGKATVSAAAVSRGIVVAGNEDGKISAWRDVDGEPVWEFDAGSPVLSDPSIGGDTVYAGAENGKLFALDLVTGRLRWDLPLGQGIHSSPALTKHGLYVAAGTTLYALR